MHNLGKRPKTPSGEFTSELYGPGANFRHVFPKINTRRPFGVRATFAHSGEMTVELEQASHSKYSHSSASLLVLCMTRAAPTTCGCSLQSHTAAASDHIRLQEGHSLRVYDTAIAGNPEPSGVPPYAFDLTAEVSQFVSRSA